MAKNPISSLSIQSQFVSREINHKLRTNIACILGLVKILENDNLTNSQLELIKNIETSAQDLLASVELLTSLLNQNSIVQPTTLNILLVEDEPILQRATSFLLESKGYHVDIATNGKIAIEKFSNGYDVIFMDIRMPEMNGFEATKAIRKLETANKHVPIIALTAEGLSIKEECFAAGMNEFMLKPLNIDLLENLLQQIHSKK